MLISGAAINVTRSWRVVTDKEVEEALKREAVKRFGKDWENAKIEECSFNGRNGNMNSSVFSVAIGKNSDGWMAWNKNGCILYKGKWAEPLEEEFEPFQKVLVRDFDDNKWRIDFFSNVDDKYGFKCLTDYWYQCIPFTGNKHLLNTKKNI